MYILVLAFSLILFGYPVKSEIKSENWSCIVVLTKQELYTIRFTQMLRHRNVTGKHVFPVRRGSEIRYVGDFLRYENGDWLRIEPAGIQEKVMVTEDSYYYRSLRERKYYWSDKKRNWRLMGKRKGK